MVNFESGVATQAARAEHVRMIATLKTSVTSCSTAVAEESTVTGAARRLQAMQATLSDQLVALERRIGVDEPFL